MEHSLLNLGEMSESQLAHMLFDMWKRKPQGDTAYPRPLSRLRLVAEMFFDS